MNSQQASSQRIIGALKNIKDEIEEAITTRKYNGKIYTNGNIAENNLIRSQKPINYIHNFIKGDFIANGVNPSKIYPPMNESKPEIEIKGFLKKKKQDICIVPNADLIDKVKSYHVEVGKIMTVNVRSQLSSLGKNIDTLYERTFAEALNLHLNYPKQCLGEVYLIPAYEYDDQKMKNNEIGFKKNASKIEKYIKLFQAINNRNQVKGNEYKYERVFLLIVDFSPEIPKLYSNVNELKHDKLLPEISKVSLDKLTINNFIKDLIDIYSQRFSRDLLG